MSETTTAARPDLSALDYPKRVRIAVAETQGWTYAGQHNADPGVPVGIPPAGILAVRRQYGLGDTCVLPDYLNDPAAWGALMRSERIDIEHYDGGVLAAAASDEKHPSREFDGWTGDQAEIGPAICQAVLHKYGIDWKTLEPER